MPSDFDKAIADVKGFLFKVEPGASASVATPADGVTITPVQVDLVLRALSAELHARGIKLDYWIGADTIERIKVDVLARLERGEL